MSWPVRIRPRAEFDLPEAARWYEAQRVGLGARYLDELQRLILSLADNALLYPDRKHGFRRAFARRFPYVVNFQVHRDSVVILRVLHMRRERPEP